MTTVDGCGVVYQSSKFVMSCYRDASGSGTATGGLGRQLSFPATVVRGEPLSCYVNASMLWDPQLQLVVTDCRFTTPYSANLSTLTYHFIQNKYVYKYKALDTRSRNRRHRPNFDAAPKAVNDVRSRSSARKTGAGIWRRIYGDSFWSECQGLNSIYSFLCHPLVTHYESHLYVNAIFQLVQKA